MKVALVHDHLTQDGGAERVLASLHALFPSAPIITLVHRARKLAALESADVRSSYLQSFPFRMLPFPWLFPLMPFATESHDLSEFDVVLSSSSGFSKGVITKPSTLHICYCHTPARYLWSDTHSYMNDFSAPRILKMAAPLFINQARQWDHAAADRVDYFVANSRAVARRIRKYYRRESTVIYPPVDVTLFRKGSGDGGFYLAGGRLVSYKRLDIVVEAFNRLGKKIKIFGVGPEYSRLRSMAKKNVEFLGFVSEADKIELFEKCTAYIHPQEEDFGITAVEAAAAGRPVIAFAAGGALETVIEGVTGHFFQDQDAAALIDAILRFKPDEFNSEIIRNHAVGYDVERFKKEIQEYVNRQWMAWLQHGRG